MRYETKVTYGTTPHGGQSVTTEQVPVYNRFEKRAMERHQEREDRRNGVPRKKKHSNIILRLLFSPFTIITLLGIIIIFIVYIISSTNTYLTDLVTVYQSLSAKPIDSKVGFDKRLFYITVNKEGKVTVNIGAKSQEKLQEAASAANQVASNAAGENKVVAGNDYVGQLIKTMQTKGYNEFAISAILGNFNAESGLNPGTTQGHTHDNCSNDECVTRGCTTNKGGDGHGIAQWDGGRRQYLIENAIEMNEQWYDFEYQLNYLLGDLSSQDCGVDTFNNNATDIEHAVYWFAYAFERCGISSECPGYNKSNKYAASQIKYNERTYINGWENRLNAAKDRYNTYFKET